MLVEKGNLTISSTPRKGQRILAQGKAVLLAALGCGTPKIISRPERVRENTS